LFFILFLQPMLTEKIILPTAYFPPVSWMAAALKASEILIETQETYPKQTIRNHCNILTANGILKLSVPVSKPFGNQTKTHQVKVLYQDNWPQKHFRAIESAYNNSPYYQYYASHFQRFFMLRFDLLTDLNAEALALVNKLLKTEMSLNYTENWEPNHRSAPDYRFLPENNSQWGLENQTPYIQVFSDRFEFFQNPSVLDVIFNLGPRSTGYLKSVNTIIQDKQS